MFKQIGVDMDDVECSGSKPTGTSVDVISWNYYQMHNEHSKQRSFVKSFWMCWDSKYQKYITEKRQGTVSINYALNCTKEMTCNHLNKLTEELIKTNIFIDAIQLETGVWQGDVDSTRVKSPSLWTMELIVLLPNGLVYVGQGESCQGW